MSLRSLIQQSIKAGTAAYAIVEAVYLGMATVRIIGNSHRLTNIPYFGNISVGDRVIINQSTDSPYIYSFVGIEDLPDNPEEAPSRPETSNPLSGLVCGKLTHSEEYEVGTAFSYSYGPVLTRNVDVTRFDTVLYDTHNLYAKEYNSTTASKYMLYGFAPKVAGVYFVRVTLGISTDEPNEWRWWSYLSLRGFKEYGTTTIYWGNQTYVTACEKRVRFQNPDDEIVTFTIGNLYRLEPGDAVAPVFYWRASHNTYGSYGRTQYNYLRAHKEEEKYPYFEWVLVAAAGQEEHGQRYWWDG